MDKALIEITGAQASLEALSHLHSAQVLTAAVARGYAQMVLQRAGDIAVDESNADAVSAKIELLSALHGFIAVLA